MSFPAFPCLLARIEQLWDRMASSLHPAPIVTLPTYLTLGHIFSLLAGSGRQWMSWIHRDDLVNLIIAALSNPSYKGIYNATAPKPVRMSELCSELGGWGWPSTLVCL